MKAFLNEQYKEIEENNRMGKTRELFKKLRDNGNISCKDEQKKDRKGMDITKADNFKKA